LVAGCSQDSSRYADDPFSSPFRSGSDVTGTVPSTSGAIESRPLAGPPPQPGYNPPPHYASNPPSTVPAAPAPAYSQPQYAARGRAGNGEGEWRWDGGSAVTLQHGETVDMVARRYGVPTWALLRANNLADASRVQPGTRLVIPYQDSSYTTASAPAPAPNYSTSPYARPAPAATRGTSVHVVNHGETLYSLGRRYGLSHAAIAQANGMHDQTELRVGQRLTIPGPSYTSNRTLASPAAYQRAEAPVETPVTQAAISGPQKAASVTAVDEPEEARPLGGSPQFRWPVRGRVISGFGAKSSGQHNDGINLAVPEGTEVKAAENGVVAYAGNELKGYGNLVLLRHSDGWMTAYAHNSQVLVKRGDQIRRGQTIARAGQTGGVTSPQVHFEIRKGSTPVDPTQYLSAL
jgi:murein DD-endopeptidase MepM/ murein hydrolase activator NlpD